jgi:L-ascorbate metabolism protein UlaG (beta-lactamase superfamily)
MYIHSKMKCVLLNFALILVINFGYSQSNQLTVHFIGNCGLYLTDGTSNIYFDFPYKSGAHHYMEYNLSELDSIRNNPVFIYTHKHSDHYTGLVKKLAKKQNGKIYTPANAEELTDLNTELKDFKIEVFQTKHRFSFNHCSYLLTWHGKRIFISGDTEQVETLASLKNIDYAFIPVWLLMDGIEKGIKLKEVVDIFAIYHIGPRDKITFDNADPRMKLLTKQGEIIPIAY